jgi:catechol-2,3-dioxygenase
MNVTGFNHVTINVSELSQALYFYVEVLKMKPVHYGTHDVYLEWGNAWICLQENQGERPHPPHTGIDHIAFFIAEEDFASAVTQLKQVNVPVVRGPLRRGKGWSINFLDPDGTELELHTSTLAERMEVWE